MLDIVASNNAESLECISNAQDFMAEVKKYQLID